MTDKLAHLEMMRETHNSGREHDCELCARLGMEFDLLLGLITRIGADDTADCDELHLTLYDQNVKFRFTLMAVLGKLRAYRETLYEIRRGKTSSLQHEIGAVTGQMSELIEALEKLLNDG